MKKQNFVLPSAPSQNFVYSKFANGKKKSKAVVEEDDDEEEEDDDDDDSDDQARMALIEKVKAGEVKGYVDDKVADEVLAFASENSGGFALPDLPKFKVGSKHTATAMREGKKYMQVRPNTNNNLGFSIFVRMELVDGEVFNISANRLTAAQKKALKAGDEVKLVVVESTLPNGSKIRLFNIA